MAARLAVWALSDSFAEVWEDLAAQAGLALRTCSRPDELSVIGGGDLVVFVVAGIEEEAAAGLEVLRAAGIRDPAVVGSAIDHRIASVILRAGASDYFAFPGDVELLRGWVVERSERIEAATRASTLAEQARARYDFSRMVGDSPNLHAVLERAARIIPHASATVLITGETGTGKEVLARAIHFNGPRAAAPFVEINCTAVPATLLEAELFGYEPGAFTDARTRKPGLFEAADGGTLFLDEIGDLTLELQAKLLKVLEEKQVRRLGSLRTLRVDLRILAATHVDLATAVRDGRFRQDLYYRLNVVPLHLPALRDRHDDVIRLAEHFLGEFAAEYGIANPGLSPSVRLAILGHAWPGNVRELRNAIERALLLGSGPLDPADLFPAGLTPHAGTSPIPFPATLDQIATTAARAMVERFEGNKSAAAEALGISRSRLYRLLGPDL